MAGEQQAQETKVFRYSWRPAAAILGAGIAAAALLAVFVRFSPIGAALIVGASALFASYFAALALRVKLVIDPRGVSYIERHEKQLISWENVHAVSCGPVAGRRGARQYSLYNYGNVVVSFDNEIADSERAYRTIERRISVELYPRYREALYRGEVIRFGVISLSKQSLSARHLALPASEARLVRDGHSLTIIRRSTAETLLSVDEGEVQNINILLRCASELDPNLVGHPKAFRAAA